MVSHHIDQSRDENIAISLGPRFSGEKERFGKIAMPISASRLDAVDDMKIGRLGASISQDGRFAGDPAAVLVLLLLSPRRSRSQPSRSVRVKNIWLRYPRLSSFFTKEFFKGPKVLLPSRQAHTHRCVGRRSLALPNTSTRKRGGAQLAPLGLNLFHPSICAVLPCFPVRSAIRR